MEIFVRLLNGKTKANCTERNWMEYSEIARADECPEGFKQCIKTNSKPDVPNGKQLAFTYEDDGTKIYKTYYVISASATDFIIKYSKLKCYVLLKELGYWNQVKSWLEENELWDAFCLANYVAEDNEMFQNGLKTMQGKLGLSDE